MVGFPAETPQHGLLLRFIPHTVDLALDAFGFGRIHQRQDVRFRHGLQQAESEQRRGDARRGQHLGREFAVGQIHIADDRCAQLDLFATFECDRVLRVVQFRTAFTWHTGHAVLVQLPAVGCMRFGATVLIGTWYAQAHQHRTHRLCLRLGRKTATVADMAGDAGHAVVQGPESGDLAVLAGWDHPYLAHQRTALEELRAIRFRQSRYRLEVGFAGGDVRGDFGFMCGSGQCPHQREQR